MTYDDFVKILDDTQSIIISKDLFNSLLESQNEKTKQNRGHWITHECNEVDYIECSGCSVWFKRDHLIRNSYCPNCGQRKLVKGEHDADS